MKVFVTGGNGFIGSVVVRSLVTEKHEVSCLLRPTSNTDRISGVKYQRIEGDVRDAAAVKRGVDGSDAVIHLASLPNWNDIDSRLMAEAVEGGTRTVLDAARKQGNGKKPRVVFVSSVLAVNGSTEPRTFDETSEWSTPDRKLGYSRSKRTAE